MKVQILKAETSDKLGTIRVAFLDATDKPIASIPDQTFQGQTEADFMAAWRKVEAVNTQTKDLVTVKFAPGQIIDLAPAAVVVTPPTAAQTYAVNARKLRAALQLKADITAGAGTPNKALNDEIVALTALCVPYFTGHVSEL